MLRAFWLKLLLTLTIWFTLLSVGWMLGWL